MNVEYLSIYLPFLQLLSLIFIACYFTSLKFISKYFIVFHDIVNEVVFFISFSDILLLAYTNSAEFAC